MNLYIKISLLKWIKLGSWIEIQSFLRLNQFHLYFTEIDNSMPNIYTLLLFASLKIILTLHTQPHYQVTTTNNDQQYARGLQLRMAQLGEAMTRAKVQIDNLSAKIRATGITPTQQVTTFQNAVNEEKTALSNLEAYLNLPLNTKPCNSTQQAIQQRNSLRVQSDSANTALLALKKELASCAKCTITDPLSQSQVRQENYIYVTNQITDSSCTNVPKSLTFQTPTGLVDLSQSTFKNNLNAKNWVFGNTTEDLYKMQVFASSIKYNLTDCPLQKPYVHPLTKDCFNCPEGLSFNLGTKSCEGCPTGSQFSLMTNNCECGQNQKYNPTTKKCQIILDNTTLSTSICPNDKPIWNDVNKLCQPCPPATPIFDTAQKKCISCPPNTTWNVQIKQCIPVCPANNTYNVQLKKCVANIQCDAYRPVFNSITQTCQACPSTTQWNANTKICECPQGTTLNANTKLCQKVQVQPQQCDDLKPIWNATSLTCQICPQLTPVWNKLLRQCQACPATTPVYDYALFKCVEKICEPGFKWNKDKLKCSPQSQPCAKEQIYNFLSESCVNKCETNHTYFPNNDTCSCFPQKPFYNSTTRLCTQPPCDAGLKWNPKVLKCIPLDKKCQAWQTYDFDFGDCVNKCQVNITYVKANDSCLCPTQKPVLDLATRKCKEPDCQNGTVWNPTLLKCSPVDKKCQLWQAYNFSTQSCVNKCEVNHPYVKQTDSCVCPADYPVFDPTTRLCKQPVCESQSLWNKYLMKCSPVKKVCEKWQKYNFTLEDCEAKCQVNQTYFQKNDTCTCPAQRPNYVKQTRTCTIPSCPAGTSWNNQLLKCSPLTKVCAKWEVYNFATQSCIKKCEENQTYFATNDTCTCPPVRPLYNNITKQCTQPVCPADNKWNPNLLKCSLVTKKCEVWQIYNFTDQKCYNRCEVNQTYYAINNTCSCPPQRPYYDVTLFACIEPKCDAGMKWNKYKLKCSPETKKCEAWQQYNFTLEECVNQCEINHTFYKENDTCSCFPQAPLFEPKTRKCIIPPCAQGSQWNKNLKRCSPLTKQCQAWELYNFTTQACDKKCQNNRTYIKQIDTCQCQPEFPIFDKTTRSCVEPKCESQTLWNKFLLKCSPVKQICEKWQNYDFTTESCITRCEVGHTYYQQNDSCSCFPEKPVFNRTSRVCEEPTCESGTKWNVNLQKCSPLDKKCQIWQQYNFANESCVNKCQPNQTYYKVNDTCSCIPVAPVFDRTTRKCVYPQCPAGQIWNTTLIKCAVPWSCPLNMVFDVKTSQCVCKQGFHYYDLYKSCKPTCKVGQYLNTLTMLCQPIKVVPVTCGKNMYLTTTGKCECLAGYVLRRDGVNCRFNCTPGFRYNTATNSCEIIGCQSGFSYNTNTRKCEPLICPMGSYYNEVKKQCQACPAGYNYNSATKLCQLLTNLACPVGYTFNAVTKLCDLIPSNCSTGQYYNNSTKTCMDLYITSPQAANIITSNMNTYTQTYVRAKSTNPKLQDCVSPTPFYDKNSRTCVQCSGSQPYFNLELGKCQDCGTGVYNSTTFSCTANTAARYNFDPTIGRFVMNIF